MKANPRTVLFLAGMALVMSNPCVWAHTDVTAEEARILIDSTDDLIVVDVREPSEYCDAVGHIPGARNYPWNSGALQARYEELPTDAPVLVVCRSGGRSNAAANFLDSRGFATVYDMLGGMSAWAWETSTCKYSGGSGTADDPYQIATAEQMNQIGLHEEDWDKHFRLMANIDLAEHEAEEFKLIGFRESWDDTLHSFRGVFDGNGHTLSNINVAGAYLSRGVGLFGCVDDPNAEIRNLGVIDPNIYSRGEAVGALVGDLGQGTVADCYAEGGTVYGWDDVGGLIGLNREGVVKDCHSASAVRGQHAVGGLVGANSGLVSNCHTITFVLADDERTGGLVGSNYGRVADCWSAGDVRGTYAVGGLVGWGGNVTNSYSTCTVFGYLLVGGLLGSSHGDTLANCYSTGTVSGLRDVGGLVGWMDDTNVINCYSLSIVSGEENVGGLVGRNKDIGRVRGSFWEIETSEVLQSDGGTPLPRVEMMDINTYLVAGWDFVDEAYNGTEDIWQFPDSQAYPRLRWENIPDEATACELSDLLDGKGTQDHPYLIYTAEELSAVGLFECDWGRHFKLMADIDLSDHAASPFNIIGRWAKPFTGVFDGDGHTISNFTYECSEGRYVGLFGQVRDPNAVIKNLRLMGPFVDAGQASNVGSLIGCLEKGTIVNCCAQGVVVFGTEDVGGLVGHNKWGHVTGCRSDGTVTGLANVGGLMGSNNGRLTQCHSSGMVDGSESVGGLVGSNGGNVADCYASVNVTGDKFVAGLVGDDPGVVTNCYSTGTVVGTYYAHVGGIAGFMSKGDVIGSFWDVETSGLQKSGGGQGKTTAEMQTASTFLDAGWDFVEETDNGTEDIWWLLERQDYPRLWWEAALE